MYTNVVTEHIYFFPWKINSFYFRSRPVLDIFTSVSGELENIDPDKQGCEMDRTASTVWYVLFQITCIYWNNILLKWIIVYSILKVYCLFLL